MINLRLKSNAMFWKSVNAESMLQLRSRVISRRWDGALVELSDFRRTTAGDGYAWQPKPMSWKVEDSYCTAT